MAAPDWLELCRRAAGRAAEALSRQADRSQAVGLGAGGDTTLALDRAAEDAVFTELEALDGGLVAISEERGEVELKGGGPLRVVIDPVDGSRNARRSVAPYALSVAVAEGPLLEDVTFGFVHEFGLGQEWWAQSGEGAFRDGERLMGGDAGELELLGLENTHPARVAGAAAALEATGAQRLRALGAVAVSLCHVASGGLDAMLTLGETRSVDMAAGQLVVREAGGAVALPEAGDLRARLTLDMRSRVLAAATPAVLDRLRTAFP